VQRTKSAFTRVFDALWRRRAGTASTAFRVTVPDQRSTASRGIASGTQADLQ